MFATRSARTRSTSCTAAWTTPGCRPTSAACSSPATGRRAGTGAGPSARAATAHRMGMVNAVVPHAGLEAVALEWAGQVNAKSPTAVRMLKYAFNLIDDGLVGQQLFAGEATRLAYGTDEAAEGRDAFLEKRPPDWSPYPYAF